MRDSFRYPQGFKIDGANVYLPKIGWVKFRKSREIEGEIKQATVHRERKHWYVAFSTEQEVPNPPFASISEERAVGIDLGLEMREYRCPNCAMSMDRDLNSGIIEKAAGMSVLKACGATP